MNWRTLCALLAALLLVLPLVLVVMPLLQPTWPEVDSSNRRISPMLTREARAQLRTYLHDCGLSLECEPPLGCLQGARPGRQYCFDSQCTTDAQCPEGQRCRNLATWGDGPLVRFCVPTGVRQEGEGCIKLPADQNSACAENLICGGSDGWCARPCRLGDTAGCPEGFFCADTLPEPLCLPTCAERGCPSGQFCTKFDEGTSICAHVYGPNCQQSRCPEGRPFEVQVKEGGQCEVLNNPDHPGKVWMECTQRCGEGQLPCPAGLTCDGWQCRTPCNPADPSACIEGYYCGQWGPGDPWVCLPAAFQ